MIASASRPAIPSKEPEKDPFKKLRDALEAAKEKRSGAADAAPRLEHESTLTGQGVSSAVGTAGRESGPSAESSGEVAGGRGLPNQDAAGGNAGSAQRNPTDEPARLGPSSGIAAALAVGLAVLALLMYGWRRAARKRI